MKVKQQVELAGVHRNCLWDRMPGESGKAYEAFVLYREMGVKRGLTELSRMLGKHMLVARRWRIIWDWDLRCAAWDAKLSKARDDAAIEEAKRMGVRHAQLGMELQAVGGKRLKSFGESEELQASLTARDTIALIKEGAELERTARGEDPDKGKQGNIVFNLHMHEAPKWAPDSVKAATKAGVAAAKVIQGQLAAEGIEGKLGDNPQEATP